MTTDTETTPRRRGRPRRVVEDHQAEVSSVEHPLEDFIDSDEAVQLPQQALSRNSQLEEENAAMRSQLQYQMAIMMKMAQKLGIDMEDNLETPPKEDVVVIDPEPEAPRPTGRPRPGTILGNPGDRNPGWVPWRKEDLEDDEVVTFVPQPIPSLVYPRVDEEGREKIRLDVNDLVCWLTVGVPNTVHKFFKNAYDNGYDNWKDLENFKRHGPEFAPWASRSPDGRPAWYFEPMATSFGMDEDGHAITPFRNASPLYRAQGSADAI